MNTVSSSVLFHAAASPHWPERPLQIGPTRVEAGPATVEAPRRGVGRPRKVLATAPGASDGATARVRTLYRLHVALEAVELTVWRRILVPDTLNLARLGDVLQTAMGWTNGNLHEFCVDGQRYGMLDDDYAESPALRLDQLYSVGQVLGESVSAFSYAYDFGDNWCHSIVVEAMLSAEGQDTAPRCVDGANACPPEHLGGVTAYQTLLRALRDPSVAVSASIRRRCEQGFDPHAFDVAAVNQALRQRRL